MIQRTTKLDQTIIKQKSIYFMRPEFEVLEGRKFPIAWRKKVAKK